MNNNHRQQILAYKCRVLAGLADSLAPYVESAGIQKGLELISSTLQEVAAEITRLEPDPEEIPLRQVLPRPAGEHSVGRNHGNRNN
jgi:hypothetical protein